MDFTRFVRSHVQRNTAQRDTTPRGPKRRGARSAALVALVGAALAGGSGATWALPEVAIVGAPSTAAWNPEVQAKLVATGQFATVDLFDAASMTPSLAQMQNYCGVLVYDDTGFNDATALGNNLADYVDAGGGVVLATFVTASIPLAGRFDADNYYAIQPTSQQQGTTESIGTIFVPGHPILQGDSSFSGGASSYRPSADSLHPSAIRIADWTGFVTVPLIATRIIGGVRRADLGFYPPSSDSRADFWDASTDGALIMANALTWVCGQAVCGNGSTESGEQCDDGNTVGGDCCSATCQYEALSSPCNDGNACTTVDGCDGAGMCAGTAPPDCDDNNPCTQDSCDSGSGCVNDAAPVGGCRSASKTFLLLKNHATDEKDKLVWKWLKGAETMLADLGAPSGTTNYALCLYSGTTSATVALPAGSKWQPTGSTGFKYTDPAATPNGARKALLKVGAAGKAKALVKGKGTDLPDDLAPALGLPVTVQLVNDANSVCYETVFNSTIKNDSKQFKAKGP